MRIFTWIQAQIIFGESFNPFFGRTTIFDFSTLVKIRKPTYTDLSFVMIMGVIA